MKTVRSLATFVARALAHPECEYHWTASRERNTSCRGLIRAATSTACFLWLVRQPS